MILSHMCYTSGSSMFCLPTKFHLPKSHGLLVITMNCIAKNRFCIAAILFFIISPCSEIMVILHDMTAVLVEDCIFWLLVGLIILIDEPASNSLSVVSCHHFHECLFRRA